MNKSNIAFVVIAAVSLLALASAQTNRNQPSVGLVGRYQLIYGEHEISTHQSSEKVIVRLDTVTGAASEWIEGSDDSWWHPINEKPGKQ